MRLNSQYTLQGISDFRFVFLVVKFLDSKENHRNSNGETTTGTELGINSTLPFEVYQPVPDSGTFSEKMSRNRHEYNDYETYAITETRKQMAAFKKLSKRAKIQYILAVLALLVIVGFLCLSLMFTEESNRRFLVKQQPDTDYDTESECSDIEHNCNDNANCALTEDGFDCYCKTGFRGHGINCTGELFVCPYGRLDYILDIDECAWQTHNCNDRQTCANTVGGFDCVTSNSTDVFNDVLEIPPQRTNFSSRVLALITRPTWETFGDGISTFFWHQHPGEFSTKQFHPTLVCKKTLQSLHC